MINLRFVELGIDKVVQVDRPSERVISIKRQ